LFFLRPPEAASKRTSYFEHVTNQVKKILRELEVEDYSEGPLEEKLYANPEMWVFGKEVKTVEVYIKISLGLPSAEVICISFHKAEFSISYPYKK